VSRILGGQEHQENTPRESCMTLYGHARIEGDADTLIASWGKVKVQVQPPSPTGWGSGSPSQ
jgi:hypothetical protein